MSKYKDYMYYDYDSHYFKVKLVCYYDKKGGIEF